MTEDKSEKAVDDFINQMLDEAQLSGVTDDVRVMLVADLKERLLDQINQALLEALPSDKVDEFDRLLDDETVSDESVQQFIADSGVDIQRVSLRTMLRFAELYLGRQGLEKKAN